MSDGSTPEELVPISKRLAKHQARALAKQEFISYLVESDLSDGRRYFELARYSMRQHDKAELMAGAVVGIIAAIALGGGAWIGTLLTGLTLFGATLIVIFLIHWIRSPSAFHKAATAELRNKTKELESITNHDSRRAFVIERLKELLKDHKQLEASEDPLQQSSIVILHEMEAQIEHVQRARKFLERYISSEHLAGYPWNFGYIRTVLEDIHQRLVDGEIEIKPREPSR
jgi:hypothetical protein